MIKVTKNADPDKYIHSGYGIAFDFRSPLQIEAQEKISLVLELT